jgi:hypothetical protein
MVGIAHGSIPTYIDAKHAIAHNTGTQHHSNVLVLH